MKCQAMSLCRGKASLILSVLFAINSSIMAAKNKITGFVQGHFAWQHTEDGLQNAFSIHRARLGAKRKVAEIVAYSMNTRCIVQPSEIMNILLANDTPIISL